MAEIRECTRHGAHDRWYHKKTQNRFECALCTAESMARMRTRKYYRAIEAAQGRNMADAYLSAVNAGIPVMPSAYIKGLAAPTIIGDLRNLPESCRGRGAVRRRTVEKFAPADLDGASVCERCLNPPPRNGKLRPKMITGPNLGGRKTRDNTMILCPVCRSLTISAMKRSAPPVWTGKDWVWAQVMPQDIENLWQYAAKWMTPEQRVQYANASVEAVSERDATLDMADPGAELVGFEI